MKHFTRKLENYKFKSYLYPSRYKTLSLKTKNKIPFIEIKEFINFQIKRCLNLTLNEFNFIKSTMLYNVKNIKIYNRKLFIIPLKNRKFSIIKLKDNQQYNIILNDIENKSLINYQCELYDKLDTIKY